MRIYLNFLQLAVHTQFQPTHITEPWFTLQSQVLATNTQKQKHASQPHQTTMTIFIAQPTIGKLLIKQS